MSLTTDDRVAIHELIALHGHLVDEGALERLDELLTADVVYDLSDFGAGELNGIQAIRDAAILLGDRNPVGHHVTNIIVTDHDESAVHVRSKGIGIQSDGYAGSVVYEDVVVRTPHGWRIRHRRVVRRRVPLGD